jgi:hypothetical protein
MAFQRDVDLVLLNSRNAGDIMRSLEFGPVEVRAWQTSFGISCGGGKPGSARSRIKELHVADVAAAP